MSTLRVSTIQNASSSTANLTLDASGNATVGNTLVMGSSFKRNRIINGDMRVDQRNAGASTTPTSDTYVVDRWQLRTPSGIFSAQTQTSTVPTGFTNAIKLTVVSAAGSISAGTVNNLTQYIEGYNIADLGWGTASAKTITISFLVNTSVAGTYPVAFYNSAYTATYVATYTISAPNVNTWQTITLTIPGATSGTWLTTNGQGINVCFDLGSGSNYNTTANTWGSSGVRTSGTVSLSTNSSATFYITGVQLETGSVATPYERQIYSEQLAQCQRYYYRATGGTAYQVFGQGKAYSTGTVNFLLNLPTTMRATPTSIDTSAMSTFQAETGATSVTTPTSITINTASGSPQIVNMDFTKSGSFTAGAYYYVLANNTSGTSAYVGASAEL